MARNLPRQTLIACLAALVLWHVMVLGHYCVALIQFPYDVNYGEGYVLNDALRLVRGESICQDIQNFPMVRSPYPPTVLWLLGSIGQLLGPELWPGRVLMTSSLAAIIALVGWGALRAGGGAVSALVAMGMLIASPYVYQWAALVRVDMPALLFSTAAVVAAQWVSGRRGVGLAAALAALAVASKQTAVSAGLAITLAYAMVSWRRALGFAGLWIAPLLISVWILEVATNGQFSQHVIFGNATNTFDMSRLAVSLVLFALLQGWLVAVGLWGAVAAWKRHRRVIAVYAVLALLTSLSVGSEGSSQNYFLEGIIGCALALPFGWQAGRQRFAAVGPVIAVVQLLLVLHDANGDLFYPSRLPLLHVPVAADYQAAAVVDAAVAGEPRAVLSDAAGFLVRHGRPVYVQPFDLRAAQDHGRWTSVTLVEALRSGEFGLVVNVFTTYPPDVETVLASDYILVTSVPAIDGLTYRLYRPKVLGEASASGRNGRSGTNY